MQRASTIKRSQNVSQESLRDRCESSIGCQKERVVDISSCGLQWEYGIRCGTSVSLVLNTALQRSETTSTTRCRTHCLQLFPHLLVGVEEFGYASVNANALAFAEFAVQVSLVNAF